MGFWNFIVELLQSYFQRIMFYQYLIFLLFIWTVFGDISKFHINYNITHFFQFLISPLLFHIYKSPSIITWFLNSLYKEVYNLILTAQYYSIMSWYFIWRASVENKLWFRNIDSISSPSRVQSNIWKYSLMC